LLLHGIDNYDIIQKGGGEHMIRIKELMAMFGISKTTVYVWMKNGMPHIYVGKLLFFEKDRVSEWVQNHGN